jgi:hypothetical protein
MMSVGILSTLHTAVKSSGLMMDSLGRQKDFRVNIILYAVFLPPAQQQLQLSQRNTANIMQDLNKEVTKHMSRSKMLRGERREKARIGL